MNNLAEINSYLAEVNTLTVFVRLLLAVILGGLIGVERGSKRQAAGFRTHILVCVGATLAMLTNQFVLQTLSYTADPTRMAAQVITGVGFLGVGTILVTGKHKIKGLTTAAGLWTSACIGLAIGIGFYSGAVIASILVLLCLEVFIKLEDYFYSKARTMDIYLELTDVKIISSIRSFLNEKHVIVHESFINRSDITPEHGISYQVSIKLPKALTSDKLMEELENYPGVYLAQEY